MTVQQALERRLEAVETQLAFQDGLYEQLNEVVTRQDLELRELRGQVHAMAKRLRELGEAVADGGSSGPADEVPPHY